MSGLDTAVAEAFGPEGPLARAHPHYRERAEQRDMALAVAQAIDARAVLVTEAGTGVGVNGVAQSLAIADTEF